MNRQDAIFMLKDLGDGMLTDRDLARLLRYILETAEEV